MSAKYTCNVCGKKLSEKCNVFKEHEFIDDDIRVQFIVDFNQWTEKDICDLCALLAIRVAAKKLRKKHETTQTKTL